ncbi:hypothetical protein SCLCIDRAFT_1209546 [Scleroderma citrinum Foug A]|uniref:Uncharacterized protein n=1 Tax=Scleroderma citrinum Foug A TaxID=1036808 RepID=A0A0C3E5U9_9AGAM|nr:hypothetical protein SCLCIDRAFT_1209546 [Scleroderma citrinum Foug A]
MPSERDVFVGLPITISIRFRWNLGSDQARGSPPGQLVGMDVTMEYTLSCLRMS